MTLATVDFAPVITLNAKLLKDLPLDAVLEVHPLIDASSLEYQTVQKTKPIKARPINTILDKSETSIFEKMLLSTLEGAQDLSVTPSSVGEKPTTFGSRPTRS